MVLRLLVIVLASLTLAVPALAITGGEIDGDQHPSVGMLLGDRGNGPEPACSAALVSSTVVLTAGHCTAQMPSNRVWVSFDTRYDPRTSELLTGTAYTDPLFNHDRGDMHELGVVVLDEPVADITPLALPTADSLATPREALVAVGYGYADRETGGGPPTYAYDGFRRFVETPLKAVTPTTAITSSTGGGTCFGDSGGPRLLDSTVLAVTFSGDAVCAGQATSYRVDTPSARTFLSQFVALP